MQREYMNPSTFDGGINGIPQFQDRKKMWESLDVRPVTAVCDPLEEYLDALAGVYRNGKVVYQAFQIGHDAVFQWFWSRHRLKEMFFFDTFMTLGPVEQTLGLESIDDELNKKFEWLSPLLMPGYMAWALDSGGPYERPAMSTLQIRDMANAAVDAMIEGKYENTLFFHSNAPWAAFFMDIAWDHTWVLIQIEERIVHVILATDTD
jgi:hypothetical protein